MAAKDWYARKLGVPAGPAPSNEPPQVFTPAVTQGYAPQQPSQQFQQPQNDEQAAFEEMTHSARKARSAKVCPECNSRDLATYRWAGKDNERCLNCGWPLLQSGSNEGTVPDNPGSQREARGNHRTGTWGADFSTGQGVIGKDPNVRTQLPR